jgi:UDP-N-acetylglucosamine diphosphorylase / glucose-1-phosphate thymidylyltransferase / UDP-N-acetylgalactosamine diphosphorylase / glucosamine-1-phosphate N-acetyltransferase / galactosamine-1-phosphate N-acetyltransferase
MNICIFEDAGVYNLSPVNDLRHTSELVCGAFTLKEKLENILSGEKHRFAFHVRKPLENLCREKYKGLKINSLPGENILFLNSRIIYSKDFIDGLLLTLDEFENIVLLKGKTICAAYISTVKSGFIKNKVESKAEKNILDYNDFHKSGLKEVQVKDLNIDENEELKFIDYPSDLVLHHEKEIESDLQILLKKSKSLKSARTRTEIINGKRVFISAGCKINSHSVLDASKGDIYISPDVIIEPFSFISGPVYIGEGSTVRAGTKLYGPLRLGAHCKVSGEITCSVIHSYFNKQHHGFLGHSYLCEWVNLGAGTTTSNLKNNYSQIVIDYKGRKIDTGSIFLGSIIGDHTKTGINSMLNTGSIIGISSNLFGGAYQPKNVRAFSWGDSYSGKTDIYDIDKAVSTAKISMKRRNVQMSQAYEDLLKYYFKKLK